MLKHCLILACLIAVLSSPAVAANTVIINETFENGPNPDLWYYSMNAYPYSGVFSTNHSVSSTHSYRFELHNTDAPWNDGMRSELASAKEIPLQEMIYNFSTYLPNGGAEDYAQDTPGAAEVITQWHNIPDLADGEGWTCPALQLDTDTYENGTSFYFIGSLWDSDPVTSDQKMRDEGKVHEYDLGPWVPDKGKWVHWSFHVKWGWLESQNPKIEIYKDGVLIFTREGPNTTNDKSGVQRQFGLYKWSWNERDIATGSVLTSRVIYFDDVSTTLVDNDTVEDNEPMTDGVATPPASNGGAAHIWNTAIGLILVAVLVIFSRLMLQTKDRKLEPEIITNAVLEFLSLCVVLFVGAAVLGAI